MNFGQRLCGHLQTVHEHRRIVRQLCFSLGLYHQGWTHDLSKYSLSELIPSVRYYQGNRSPYMREKELFGYSSGWLHHKGRNRHHWEYWYDMINGVWTPLEMPYRFVLEMVCDRIAACKVYQKEKYTDASPLQYYLSRNDRRYMHPATAAQLERLLRLLQEAGETQAFAQMKESLKSEKPL